MIKQDLTPMFPLIPFASKLKILGVEFERLTSGDKGKNA